jgi:serine/threonine-protein kinase
VRALGDAVYVPAGSFERGSDDPDLAFAAPAHATATAAFFIDRCETTHAEWRAFVEASGAGRPASWAPEGEPFPGEAARLPVSGISWAEAAAYARWRGKRLPTEEEWERAARGTDRRAFPWGEESSGAAANTAGETPPAGLARGPWPVGRAAGDVSAAGCADMGGNVAEWTASPFLAYPGSPAPPATFSESLRVVRGGSWIAPREGARCAARDGAPVAVPYPEIGVRLAADVPDALAELR